MQLSAGKLHRFRPAGTYGLTVELGWSLKFAASVAHRGFLPALSIVVVTFGFRALGMRRLMVSVQREGYLAPAEAKGLRSRSIP